MVNSLYAVDYSMTSSIFHKLNDTKTSLDMGLDFSELVSTLSADRLPNLSKEILMSLTCDEIMPPMSSSPLPSRISSELCDTSCINDNHTEIVSPIRSNHSPSVSTDRLPILSKESSLTCNEIMPPMSSSSPLPSRISLELCDPKYNIKIANLARVDVKSMEPKDFLNFQNYVSDRRIQTSSPRVYLKDIIEVRFQRKNYDILYETEVDDPDYKVLRFMTDRYLKHTDVLKPEFKSVPKGIDKTRKDAVINALKDISVPHKMQFWYDMPECVERVSTAKGNRSNL